MKLFKNILEISEEKYFIATYYILSGTTLKEAAWALAVGQSVGNPNVRNEWETDELFNNHSCIILEEEQILETLNEGIVRIAFPLANIDLASDGISQLLCQLQGGQVDINIILKCRLENLSLPASATKYFLGPKYGLSGFRNYTKQYNKPLLGSIVKPKVVTSPQMLLDMVKQMVDGGTDFIKEDEIMSNPSCCPLEKRVEIIANYLVKENHKVIFCHTINCDPHVLLNRAKKVHELGGNGIHLNVYSGLGAYNSLRKLDLPLFLHYQSSGAKVITHHENKYSISWTVLCQLASLMGVDTIQTGMIGGYSNDDSNEILNCLNILRKGNTLPALSCGMHPGLISYITSIVGNDYLANAGGAVHGHPGGTLSGAKAMRQAIDKNHKEEYRIAIDKWGLIN